MPKVARPVLDDRFARQRVKRSAPQPRAGLHLDEEQPRGDQRIRDVRRQVHLQSIEPEQKSEPPADEQMQAIERQAANEDAERDPRRFHGRRRRLRS
jgi:hypothetical protein